MCAYPCTLCMVHKRRLGYRCASSWPHAAIHKRSKQLASQQLTGGWSRLAPPCERMLHGLGHTEEPAASTAAAAAAAAAFASAFARSRRTSALLGAGNGVAAGASWAVGSPAATAGDLRWLVAAAPAARRPPPPEAPNGDVLPSLSSMRRASTSARSTARIAGGSMRAPLRQASASSSGRPASSTDSAPRDALRSAAPGSTIVVRWKSRSPTPSLAVCVPSLGRCASAALSINAKSPVAHSCRRIIRDRVSASRPAIRPVMSSCVGPGGKKSKLPASDSPPALQRSCCNVACAASPAAPTGCPKRPRRNPSKPVAGGSSSIQPRQYCLPKWKHIASFPDTGCLCTNGSKDNWPSPAMRSFPTPETNQRRRKRCRMSSGTASSKSPSPRKSVSPPGMELKKCIVCVAKGARNITPSTCQPLVPTWTKPSASSFDMRSNLGSKLLGCGRCSPWSREPNCSLNAIWSSPDKSVCPRKTKSRCCAMSLRSWATAWASPMASRRS
mmetsp:Transcript_141372/g.368120  ORF Transcript_141372/g.368120 Transcript_141372/m.368120 type:complete len:500 (-) Transcript_141372:404-1903(-)